MVVLTDQVDGQGLLPGNLWVLRPTSARERRDANEAHPLDRIQLRKEPPLLAVQSEPKTVFFQREKVRRTVFGFLSGREETVAGAGPNVHVFQVAEIPKQVFDGFLCVAHFVLLRCRVGAAASAEPPRARGWPCVGAVDCPSAVTE